MEGDKDITSKSINILLIEDNEGDVRLIREMLKEVKNLAFKVEASGLLIKALKLFESRKFDAILLDLNLPDSAGLETVSKALEVIRDTPIIILTELNEESLAISSVKMGIQDYLVKEQLNSILLVRSIRYAIERKKTEQKLKESEEKYKNLFEQSPMAILLINFEGIIEDCNTPTEVLFGYTKEELLGNEILEFDIFPLNSKLKLVKSYSKFLKTGVLEHSEIQLYRKDGKIVWINSYPIIVKIAEISYVLVVIQDITEQYRAQVQLKYSEEKIRNLINNISDVLMEGDIDGSITFISPQIYDIIGHQPKELLGIKYVELIHQEDKLAYEKLISGTPKVGSKYSLELKLMHKKGYYVPISIKGSTEEINNKLKMFVVLRDITEQRKIDEMMQSEIKKLKELEQIRSDLIRRISLELKTPLISIFSGSQYLLEHSIDKVDAQTHSIIELIHMGGYRLKSLADNLIFTYNIDSKELNLNLKRNNIIQIIKNCIEDIVFQAKNRKIFLNIELLKELYIEVDKLMIKRAIFNILSNAVKNTPPNGNIFVSTFDHPNYIDIIVKDDGVGLTKKEKPLLFKRFGKIERYGKGMDVDIEGAGLGLYIANEIVKLHYGEIIVKSKGRNKGSTFIIRLQRS